MRTAKKVQSSDSGSKALWPDDFDAALTEQGQFSEKPRPSLKEQLITGAKLFVAAGAVMAAIWLLDYALNR